MATFITKEKLRQWETKLTRISKQPLEFVPDFPRITQRFESFWAHECLDRPIFLASTNTNPSRPIRKRLEVIHDPERWFQEKYQDMRQIYWAGDALPYIRVDFGPVFMTALTGLEPKFVSDTTWYEHVIQGDWSNAPDWSFPDDNPWQQLLIRLLELVAEDAKGRYCVCTPNLGGSDEVLINYRGSGGLCLDVIDQPEKIIQAVQAIHPGWEKMTEIFYATILKHDAPYVQWQHLWSDKAHTLPSCDFNAMIGPEQFKTLFMPDIEQRANTVGRASFHLDGPQASRHIDVLLDCDALDVIQFTPGDGRAPARTYGEMFKKVQARGKSCLIACGKDDVFPLCEELKPEGLAFMIGGSFTPEELDQFFVEFCRRFGTTP